MPALPVTVAKTKHGIKYNTEDNYAAKHQNNNHCRITSGWELFSGIDLCAALKLIDG